MSNGSAQQSSRHDQNDAAVALLAFLGGAVCGATVGLLLAPAPGKDVRAVAATKARAGLESGRDLTRRGREFLGRQREAVRAAVDRGRQAYRQAREGAEGV